MELAREVLAEALADRKATKSDQEIGGYRRRIEVTRLFLGRSYGIFIYIFV